MESKLLTADFDISVSAMVAFTCVTSFELCLIKVLLVLL